MARIKRLLPATLAMALRLSLFFVNGSIAQPLGAGLLDYVGVSSDGTSGGTQSATRGFDLPVTVTNPQSMPVPVTVQGTSSDPLSATIDGTVDARDVNDPTQEPFQRTLEVDLLAPAFYAEAAAAFTVPSGKRLITRRRR